MEEGEGGQSGQSRQCALIGLFIFDSHEYLWVVIAFRKTSTGKNTSEIALCGKRERKEFRKNVKPLQLLNRMRNSVGFCGGSESFCISMLKFAFLLKALLLA